MKKPWWYRVLVWADGYWHVYVCNAIEKREPLAEEE